MLKKLKTLAVAGIAALALSAGAASAFEASGSFQRDFDGKSYFAITNQETGQSYRFYGTGASCRYGGQSYNNIASMMYGSFRAKLQRCPDNPSLVILYVNSNRYYTTLSRSQAPSFNDFSDF